MDLFIRDFVIEVIFSLEDFPSQFCVSKKRELIFTPPPQAKQAKPMLQIKKILFSVFKSIEIKNEIYTLLKL